MQTHEINTVQSEAMLCGWRAPWVQTVDSVVLSYEHEELPDARILCSTTASFDPSKLAGLSQLVSHSGLALTTEVVFEQSCSILS